MGSVFRRWVFVSIFFGLIAGCASNEPPAKPQKKPDDLLKKIEKKNQALIDKNKALEGKLKQLADARAEERKAFNQRLMAMEKSISLMEQNLEADPTPRTPKPHRSVDLKPTNPAKEAPKLSASMQREVEKVQLPTMDPLKSAQRSRIAEPSNRAFIVSTPAPIKHNKRAPAVKALKNESRRPEEIPTPKNSPAIAAADFSGNSAKKTKANSRPVGSLEVMKDEIWEDPDLEEPVSPIKLQVFPAANKRYNEAFKAFTRKDYQGALDQFDFFLSRYPNDIEADNAQFWRGVTYYDRKEWDRAEDEFRKVLRNYKHGATRMGFKTPDSVLMIGKIYLKKAKPIRAQYYFEWVIKKYPKSRSANKAQRELGSLKSRRSR